MLYILEAAFFDILFFKTSSIASTTVCSSYLLLYFIPFFILGMILSCNFNKDSYWHPLFQLMSRVPIIVYCRFKASCLLNIALSRKVQQNCIFFIKGLLYIQITVIGTHMPITAICYFCDTVDGIAIFTCFLQTWINIAYNI